MNDEGNRRIKLPADLGKVDRRTGDIPRGTYLVRIRSVEDRTKRDGSGRFLVVEHAIVDVLVREHEKVIGARFDDYVSLSEAARWRLREFLDAAHDTHCVGDTIDLDPLIGKWLVVSAGPEAYQGRERFRVQSFAASRTWPRAIPSVPPAASKANGPGPDGDPGAEIPF